MHFCMRFSGVAIVSFPGQVRLLRQRGYKEPAQAAAPYTRMQARQAFPSRHRQRRCVEIYYLRYIGYVIY